MFTSWWGTGLMETFNTAFPHLQNAGTVALIAWLVWIVVSIIFHELAHGWTAIKCGDPTPSDLGHMTLDPMKHMGLVSLVCLAVAGFTWGLMPVNTDNFRRKHDDALVALAGPLSNVLIALLAFGLMALSKLTLSGQAAEYAMIVLVLGFSLNVLMAIFNMLPLPPLDGSRVAASFIPSYKPIVYNPAYSIIGLIVVFVFGASLIAPIVGTVMSFAADVMSHIPARP